MRDTSPEFAAIVEQRHREMSPLERCEAASSLFETARAIVESSLAPSLSRSERRLAWARRIYGEELPEKALEAFAAFPESR